MHNRKRYRRAARGLSLVELMVAASVLSVGIVMVLRSFLGEASALDYVKNRITAMQALGNKMSELEQKSKGEGGVEPADTQEEFSLNNRNASYRLEVVPLGSEEFKEDINEARMSISWQEKNNEKNEALVAYFPNKK